MPDGTKVPDELATESWEVLWDTIGDAFKYSNDLSNRTSPDKSLMDYLSEYIPLRIRKGLAVQQEGQLKQEPLDTEAEAERRIDIALRMAGIWGSYVGSETSKQSLRFLWLEECLDGENPFVAGTYTEVTKVIAQPARDGANIKLNQTVTKICSINSATEISTIKVETRDGSSFEFDEVVVTIPLGCLKKNMNVFDPPAPERFALAVQALGYGNLDKLYVTFPEAFWDTEPTTDQSTTSTNTSPSSASEPSPTGTTFSSTSTTYPAVTTFLQESSQSPHTQETISLSSLPPPHAHPTLLFYTSSTTTTHLSSLLPPQTPYLSTHPPSCPLTPFITTHISHLPSYSPTSPSCTPTAILATNWQADEFAGHGSYTYFPVGLERGDEDVRTLREGMPERGVWIAGEHTAPFVALGTVTGAWWSGDAVARRILGIEEEGEEEKG